MAAHQKAAAATATAAEVELICLAIRRLMKDETKRAADRSSSGDGGDNRLLLLSRLLSQAESMKGEEVNHSQLLSAQENEKAVRKESERDEIVKEVREVKRQNLITQCLVSAMMILTVAWQISEISIILKLRDGLSNPFKFIGRFLRKQTVSAVQNQIEANELPHLNMPPLPHINLPDLDIDTG